MHDLLPLLQSLFTRKTKSDAVPAPAPAPAKRPATFSLATADDVKAVQGC